MTSASDNKRLLAKIESLQQEKSGLQKKFDDLFARNSAGGLVNGNHSPDSIEEVRRNTPVHGNGQLQPNNAMLMPQRKSELKCMSGFLV